MGHRAASTHATIRAIAGGSRCITFGEGWHNNHHAHPTSARHGLAWYEFDMSWMQIVILRFFGVAKGVKVAKVSSELAQRDAA